MSASAAELAYQVARVALGADALVRQPTLRIESGNARTESEVVAVLTAAPKPVRITGRRGEAAIILELGPTEPDPVVRRRYLVHRHNAEAGGRDAPPLVPASAPDDAMVLVIAFDRLLRVSKATWREFATDYWLDMPAASTADHRDAPSVRADRLPAQALEGVVAVISLGYSTLNGLAVPVMRKAWEAA